MTNDIDLSLHRVPPHNLDAERAVIGALMLDNVALGDVLSVLSVDGRDFYHTWHRKIFLAVADIIDKGVVADLITVCEALRSSGVLDKVGGPAYVAGIIDDAISAANVRHYAKIVKGMAIRRAIIAEASRLNEVAYSPMSDTEGATQEAQRVILSLTLAHDKNTLRDAKDIVKRTFSVIEARYEREGDGITGLSTGIPGLDTMTLGLHPGELIIIAGRPGMGKTALAGCIAVNIAMNGTPTVIFSLEMPAESLMTRFLAGMSYIDSRQLCRGFLQEAQWPRLVNAAGEIGSAPLFIDDNPDVTPAEIRAKARRLKADRGLGLLVVDYLQLMKAPGRHDTREQEVAEISRTLKAIARELEIPVIGLSQLNRQVDNRTNRHPQLSDLRESGAIEQDADLIAFIYRDEVYNKSEDNPERGIAEVEIAKHRNGPTGAIRLRFDATTQTFRELADGERRPGPSGRRGGLYDD